MNISRKYNLLNYRRYSNICTYFVLFSTYLLHISIYILHISHIKKTMLIFYIEKIFFFFKKNFIKAGKLNYNDLSFDKKNFL